MQKLRHRLLFIGYLIFCISSFGSQFAEARPLRLENYIQIHGGENDLPDEAYVDGSIRNQGLQPDYWLNTHDPLFDPLRKFSEQVRNRKDLPFWDRVNLLETYLKTEVLEPTPYCDPIYLDTLEEYRDSNPTQIDLINIPLSQYLIKRRGVCREHAFLLHFLLKWAGIENKHLYVKIESQKNGQMRIENHAVISIEQDGRKWIVDSYFDEFNGFLFKDLTQKSGLTQVSSDRRTPFAKENLSYRKILFLLNYPIIWIPR